MTVAAPVCRPVSRDHLGSVREVVEEGSGTLEARFAYDPWGQPTQVAGTMDVDLGFTGHHYHEKSGFHLAPFREYSAELGRWMSRDPIGENGGVNLYGYCFNLESAVPCDGEAQILESYPLRAGSSITHQVPFGATPNA